MKRNEHIEKSEREKHLNQLASVGQIAAGIAHEVKNPLTAVKGFLQLLEREGQHHYIDIARSELDNALDTLNNLLQVSKPDLQDEDDQTFSLSIELESILNLFQDKMYEVEVITDFRHTSAKILGKKSQFKKAFFNLIKNAMEAMDGKGTLMITHSLDGNDVVVTIRDTGKGIEEDKIERLGTPFYTTKAQGTGMGLTQAFSVMYQHGGEIKVESKLNQGTTFIIRLPQHKQIKKRGLRKMDLTFHDGDSLKDFFLKNKEEFEEKLLAEAINVRDKIDEIHTIGNINLVDNAHKLILFVIEERVQELIAFAKQEGVSWAKYSLTLAFKLEWIQAIRRTLWTFLFNYDTLMDKELERGAFYSLEIQINDLIDQFLTHFFISYSKYKDELLERQREIAENLSVPIIPIHSQICVLPLIGRIDEQRISTILEKVLHEIEVRRIQTLIIDLSGALTIENAIAGHLIKITEGISMMGCQTVMTGLRAELVKGLIASGETFKGQVKFKGTLQMALADMFFKSDINSSEH